MPDEMREYENQEMESNESPVPQEDEEHTVEGIQKEQAPVMEEPAAPAVPFHYFAQPRFVNRQDPFFKVVDFLLIYIDASHCYTGFGKTGSSHQPYVSASDNSYVHIIYGVMFKTVWNKSFANILRLFRKRRKRAMQSG